MIKRYTQSFMAVCLLGLFLSTASGQQEAVKQEAVKQEAVKQEVLKVGDKAPDFEVETLAGTKFKLSNQFGKDGKSTILLFSRANW